MLKELETQEKDILVVDADTANILHLIGAQSNPQHNLRPINLANREYKLNGFVITLDEDVFLVGHNVYKFSDGFINFLTNSDKKYEDIADKDE